MLESIKKAILNISTFGDTDIFPLPPERYLFLEQQDECVDLINQIHNNFEQFFSEYPPLTIGTLNQVGYTGFRYATQIELFWNAYYLALVISIADEIEKVRISTDLGAVFSYRFEWNAEKGSLFSDSTWNHYRRKALELSHATDFVVQTDIADFYSRINHHKLKNELDRICANSQVSQRIMQLLSSFSQTMSYGLPVGGPASRILAELALNNVDLHLLRRKIPFCRYADDYTLFCDSRSEAYRVLAFLSEKLANEGLSLQKQKTRILSSGEFSEMHSLLDPQPADDPIAKEEQKLLNISIRYDPYSPTAVEDYENLADAVQEIDIIGILSREIGKTAIDQNVTKQAINALSALQPGVKEQAIRILLDSDNLVSLSPVFLTIMRAVRGIYLDLTTQGQAHVDDALISLYESESHLLSLDLNLSYFLQALILWHESRKEEILIEVFDKTTNHMLRRLIILAMAKWESRYWLSDLRKHFNAFTEWERRAFIIASYRLGDEGNHWRSHNKRTWSPMETLVRDWFSGRAQAGRLDLP